MSNAHARALAEAEIINLTQQVGETGATRVHELHGETLTIFKDKELFEFAEKIARTALSAPAAVTGWQPIETAPKGGDWFIAFQGGEMYPCEWAGDEEANRFGWYSHFDRSIEEPTHWMPLPAAPKPSPEGA